MQDVRIAMIQMTCLVGDTDANIARIEFFLQEAVSKAVDIVCFPELSVSGYNPGDIHNPMPEPIPGPSTYKLESLARKYRTWFVIGMLEQGKNGVVYNTQIVYSPNGLVGLYRKTHVPSSEIGTWSQGSVLPIFEHPKVRFGIEICYDSHFPELSTALSERGAELLLLPHASGGEETAAQKKRRWLKYVPARAYDNTVFVAVCNQVGDNGAWRKFVGVTFVCDPIGEVIADAQKGSREEIVIADLKASSLAKSRSVPEWFFRHFRRAELYR